MAVLLVGAPAAAQTSAERPFGTLREQAAMQQVWLQKRLDTFLPALMRAHGIDLWVVPMREYNEDPVFSSITAPETFAARRRTIYVFVDTCLDPTTPPGAPASPKPRSGEGGCVKRIALGGTSQGGVFEARRSTKAAAGNVGRGQQAELWGDEQWQVLKSVVEEYKPRVIGIDRSTVFAFTDGLSSGELKGMSEALGDTWTSKFKDAEGLPLELIASRLPEEEAFFTKMQALVWSMTQTMFSSAVISPGKTRTSDLVWWWRQRVNDQGLGTWFHPSVEVQRKGATDDQLGDDPIIQRGDLLHCDVGITVARLNTDTQHDAYVLLPGETDAPAGLQRALANGNALQDIVMDEIRPGRTGNEILIAVAGADESEGDQRDHLLASHRRQRPRRRAVDRTMGLPGRRAGARRRESDPEHVVLDRAAGHDRGARVGRTGRPHGAGRRRHRRRGRPDPLGAQAPGQTVPGSLVAARVAAAAAQLGDLLCFLAVLAAVLAELAFFGNGAIAGGVRTLRWSHDDLPAGILARCKRRCG